MARRSHADRLTITEQGDRGWYLVLLERSACALLGHQESILQYDTFVVEEAWDPDKEEVYSFPRDVQRPFYGCMRCLAEIDLPLPPPVPVDIVDWK
jgi:hypothetical protein